VEIMGIIFDMDGTLTIPVLQFHEMRTRLGLSPSQDILPTVLSFPPERQAKAMAIIEEMEEEGVRLMQVSFIVNQGLIDSFGHASPSKS
jgi:beta-phosphoglucomutase-like phosphatase (HAD superfamily)